VAPPLWTTIIPEQSMQLILNLCRVKDIGLLDYEKHHEVFEDDDFLQVHSARRLANISGTVKAIDLKF
jgi:hypothetical protein